MVSGSRNKIEWITYNDTEILFHDWSGLNEKELYEKVEESKNVIDDTIIKPGKRDVLMIVDVTDIYLVKNVYKVFNEMAYFTTPFTKKVALIGIAGPKEIAIKMINKVTNANAKTFSDIDKAKEWLLE